MKVGTNTVALGGPSAEDIIRWSGTQASLALGDIGMNVTTGRPSAFVGGADEPLALLSEAGGSAFNSQVDAAGDITTTSTLDVPATGMSLVPGPGDYVALFTSDFQQSGNNEDLFISLYNGGVQVPNSERNFRRGASQGNVRSSMTLMAHLTVVGPPDAIEVQWRTGGSGTSTMGNRELILLNA